MSEQIVLILFHNGVSLVFSLFDHFKCELPRGEKGYNVVITTDECQFKSFRSITDGPVLPKRWPSATTFITV